MTYSFTTDDFPPAERRDVWHDVATRICCPLMVEFRQEAADIYGRVESRRLDDLDLVRVAHNSGLARRSNREISRADPRTYHLILQVVGQSRMTQCGEEAVLHQGEMALIDTSRPNIYTFDGDSINLNLHIPRQVLDLRTGHGRLPFGRTLRGNTAAITAALMRSAFDHLSDGGGVDVSAVREALLLMVASSLVGDRAAPTPDASLFKAMLAFIDARLSRSDLSPEMIARAHGVSVRQLQRLFKTEGLSVMHWVRQRRLQRCAAEFLDGRYDTSSITEICYRWGFNDSAHFSRAFKSEFGQAPRDFRATGAAAQ